MRDVPAVLLTAARLFARHWPALLTLALLGAALRSAALWAAVEVSDVQGQLGQLLLLLAPVGYLVPLIAMLAVCRGSLPHLEQATHDAGTGLAPTEQRRLRLVDVAVSVLVPFLLAYESYALLADDIARFRNAAAYDEFTQVDLLSAAPADLDFQGRLGIYPLQVAISIVVVAWVVRWALGQVERRVHLVAIAFVGAFVELFYTHQLAGQIVVIRLRGEEWVRDRVAFDWVHDAYDAVVDALGPVADAARWAVEAFGTLTGSLDSVVVVPLAWLAFGAVVLGYTLVDTRREEAAAAEGGGLLRSLWRDVRARWSSLAAGLRLLSAAGLAPMLVFSLVFLVVVRLPALLIEATRQLLGPQEYDVTIALGPLWLGLGFSLSLALTAPLLAAAVDWLVRTRTALRSQAATTRPARA